MLSIIISALLIVHTIISVDNIQLGQTIINMFGGNRAKLKLILSVSMAALAFLTGSILVVPFLLMAVFDMRFKTKQA